MTSTRKPSVRVKWADYLLAGTASKWTGNACPPNTFLGLFSALEMGALAGQPTRSQTKSLFSLDSSLLSGYKPNAINHKM